MTHDTGQTEGDGTATKEPGAESGWYHGGRNAFVPGIKPQGGGFFVCAVCQLEKR